MRKGSHRAVKSLPLTVLLAVVVLWAPSCRSKVGSLIDKLGSYDERVRKQAITELARVGQPAVPDLLKVLLHSGSHTQQTCEGVIGALLLIGDPIESLLTALKSPIPAVREMVAEALGETHDPRAIQPLVRLFYDSQLSEPARVAGAVGKLGPAAVPPLLEALASDNPSARWSAAVALGNLRDLRAVEPLIETPPSTNPFLVQEVIHALDEIGDPRAIAFLMEALKKGEHGSAEALGRIGPPAVEPLLDLLARGDWQGRPMAAAALGETRDERAIVPLIEALKDTDAKESAAEAFGRIGPAAIEPLLRAFENSAGEFRRLLARALAEIDDPRSRAVFARAATARDYLVIAGGLQVLL